MTWHRTLRNKTVTCVTALLLACLPVMAHHTIAGAKPKAGQAPLIGLHVPWAVGGPRIEADGTRTEHPGEWPQVAVKAIRLWDTRTAWLHLEPAQDLWRFEHLDAHVAKARANGVDHITLVLWGTPKWAASDLDPRDAPWLGAGSAAPPRNQADWLNYVTTVVSRYRGQIDAYQIGNEPNHRMFWRGSAAEFVSLVVAAAEVITVIDPDATVVSPPMLVTNERQLRSATRTWQALAKATDAIDAWSMHWYPAPGTSTTQFKSVLARAPKPLWLTEVGLPAAGLNVRQQHASLAATLAAARDAGVAYLAWYAWTDLGPDGLINLRRPHTVRIALGLDRV